MNKLFHGKIRQKCKQNNNRVFLLVNICHSFKIFWIKHYKNFIKKRTGVTIFNVKCGIRPFALHLASIKCNHRVAH